MLSPAETYDLSIEALQFYEDHPVEFCRDLIGVECDTWQKRAFEALVKDHFIAIRAGSGVGKTLWLSLVTMWFLGTKPNSKVPTTAPSQHQLQDLLWGEHHKWISRSTYLQRLLHWTQTKVAVKGYEPQWFAVARTARVSPDGAVAEGLQGFHAEENLLYICDEASGIPDAIFPAVEGALTGKKAYAILAANPTRLSGYFYDVFNNAQMKGMYKLFHISCLDSKYVEDRYINMMRARYGEDHPIFQIKVLGEFPSSDIMLLFSPADIEQMRNNVMSPQYDMRKIKDGIEFGIDIGRTSARSVMCIRSGLRVIEWAEKYLTGGTVDTIEITNWILGYIQSYEPDVVKIDAVGIGAGVYDALRMLYPKIIRPVVGNASCAPEKKDRFANLRAQGYWELREALPNLYMKRIPERLLVELGDVRYKFPNGKILIESKEEMMSRIGRSPDYADALSYAFLDSSICIDSYRTFVIPLHITSMNDDLKKKNIWAASNNLSIERSYSRWEQLHA